VLDSILDGFIALDRDHRCTYVNKAAATCLNTTPDQLLGRVIWEAFPQARYSQLHQEINRAVEQRVFVKFEEYCEWCGRWFEWHCYPTDEGLAIFILDASERKRAAEALAKSLADLELLSISATHYLEAMPSGDLLQYTARQLQAIAGNAVIAVSEYSPSTNQTTVRALAGPEDKLRKIPGLLGKDAVGLTFTVAEGTRERMTRPGSR
jgi:PAS domain S-box-containing protein